MAEGNSYWRNMEYGGYRTSGNNLQTTYDYTDYTDRLNFKLTLVYICMSIRTYIDVEQTKLVERIKFVTSKLVIST